MVTWRFRILWNITILEWKDNLHQMSNVKIDLRISEVLSTKHPTLSCSRELLRTTKVPFVVSPRLWIKLWGRGRKDILVEKQNTLVISWVEIFSKNLLLLTRNFHRHPTNDVDESRRYPETKFSFIRHSTSLSYHDNMKSQLTLMFG